MFAPDDGRIPVVAVFHILSIPAKVLYGCRHDVGAGFGLCIQHFDSTLVAATEHKLRIIWIESQEGTFAARRRRPACGTDATVGKLPAGNFYRTIVLLARINIVWKLVIGVNAIKLCRRHIVLRTPRFALVKSNGRSTIICNDHVVGVGWVDP